MVHRLALSIAYPLLLLPLGGYTWLRRRALGPTWPERFGRYPAPVGPGTDSAAGPLLWLHGAGLGELKVALRLAGALRELEPDTRYVFTTSTPDAYRLGCVRLLNGAAMRYFPLDFPGAVQRALAQFRPDGIVLTEMEYWPNLLRLAARRNIPVMVANGRMPEREAGSYRRWSFLFRDLLAGLSLVCLQEEADAQRLRRLGVPAAVIQVTGNLKYDGTPLSSREGPADTPALPGVPADIPVLLAGSTHPGEERLCLRLVQELSNEFPDLFLILAPRDIGRVDSVAADVRRHGLEVLRRSRPVDAGRPTGAGRRHVLIIDTLGELSLFYQRADVVLVGKSLAGRGGQDVIEAAAGGGAVVCGPHMDHFRDALQRFLHAGAILQVPDHRHLADAVRRLLRDPHRRQAMARLARTVIAAQAGATRRTAMLLHQHLAHRPPPN